MEANGKESTELKGRLFPANWELECPAEFQICRGDMMLLATLCSEGLCVDEGKALDEGIRVFTDLVSLRSRMVSPEMMSLEEELSLKFLIKLTESVSGAGLPFCLRALVAWFLKITKP